MKIVSALLLWTFAATVGVGQPQPDQVALTSLAGQVEVARLVDLAAQRLRLAIDYDATALKAAGTVTLRTGSELSKRSTSMPSSPMRSPFPGDPIGNS